MLQSERMHKIIITAPKSFLDKIINVLYKLNAIHIMSHSRDSLDIAAPLPSASKISEVLIAVRSLKSNFGLADGVELYNGFKAIGVKSFTHLSKTVSMLQEETNKKLDKIKQIDDEIRVVDTQKSIISQVKNLELPLESFQAYSSIAVLTGYVKKPELFKEELSKQTDEFEFYYDADSGLLALFVSNSSRELALNVLAKHNYTELDISPIDGIQGNSEKTLASILTKYEKLLISKQTAQRQLHRLGNKWHDFLMLSEKFLSMELEKAEAPLGFAASENIFVVSGWVPERNTEKLLKQVQQTTKGNVEIEVKEPSSSEAIPIKLVNNRVAKPFEFLMKLYALPRYNEIDPTIFLFLTFPLFFGIILGDIGYGVTTAVLLLYLAKKFPSAKPLFKVMMPAAMASIFFGFIYGEIFGFEELFGYQLPHLISRVHQINEMLAISIIIGLMHINFGILLGFINELHHGLKKAILAKGSWWVLQVSGGLALASMNNLILIPLYVPGILALVGLLMLILGEPQGIIEIPGLVSNILSYSRLMAVGLASVSLAVVVNGFIEDIASAGGIMIVLALIVGVIGHTLNIALGLLGGFLQSLRLHYVEFFTKFFKGGAIPFHPFGNEIEVEP